MVFHGKSFQGTGIRHHLSAVAFPIENSEIEDTKTTDSLAMTGGCSKNVCLKLKRELTDSDSN